MYKKYTMIPLIFFYLMSLGCSAKEHKGDSVSVSFLVYNYSTLNLEDVTVEGQGHEIVDAAKKIGDVAATGVSCCIDIPQKQYVEISYITNEGGKNQKHKIQAFVENFNDKPRSYAVLHFLPNNTAVLELAMRWPSPRKDLLFKATKNKNIKLESASMWDDKSENEAAKKEYP
ncbi:hypothetical protein [Acinetobacter indicus]|uniref:DUF3304 domain-containing protein n=1 Tax=Acinetobacter indicus TaxID=756892 RepID=A0AAW8Z164_9GAMM|nr:hypothetical protein [Acinetobacter indicus]MDV4316594.1 hypothetical protein [Acinetobacter indicus]